MTKKKNLNRYKHAIGISRRVLLRVFIALCLFLIGLMIYRYFLLDFTYGIDPHILHVLRMEQLTLITTLVLGVVTALLYLPYSWLKARLASVPCSQALRKLQPAIHWLTLLMPKVLKGRDHKSVLKAASGALFLILLSLVVLQSFTGLAFLEDAQIGFVAGAIAFGLLFFWLNRKKVKLGTEKEREKLEEAQRKIEFGEKFPKVNRIPVVGWIIRWVYKEGWGYVSILIVMMLIFVSIGIYNIYNASIGTDEGNMLYAAKLIAEKNQVPYLDFWMREPGSALVFTPIIQIFDSTIITLRYFTFVLNLVAFCLVYLIVRRYFNRTLQIIALVVSLLLIPQLFNIYAGAFYKWWVVFFLLIIFFSLDYFLNPVEKTIRCIILALLIGTGILMYKPVIVFLIIIPLFIWIKHRSEPQRFIRITLSFIAISTLPIVLIWWYYAQYTDYYHVYKVILSSVINAYLILIPIILITGVLTLFIRRVHIIDITRITVRHIIFALNIFIIGIMIYLYITGIDIASPLWGRFSLEAFFVIFVLLCLNLLTQSGLWRTLVFLITLTVYALLLWVGFGSRGFFTEVPIIYHYTLLVLMVVAGLWLTFLAIKGHARSGVSTPLLLYVTMTANILFAFLFFSVFVGGPSMPGRIIIMIPFYFIMLLTGLLTFATAGMRAHAHIFLAISMAFLIFSNVIYSQLKNDYTLYSLNDVREATHYVQEHITGEEYIFSGDSAILAETSARNLIFITSPWLYRDTNTPPYMYPQLGEKYDTDIKTTKEDLYHKMIETPPRFILGHYRTTFRTFFDASNDVNNTQLGEFLNSHYTFTTSIGNIKIYELNSSDLAP